MEAILQERYRIVRALGRGGRGAVYLCDDLRLHGKQWAIKKMHRPASGQAERFREAFRREAALLSRLSHPNLPLVVDHFETEEDAFLVMEYVDGDNLADYVRREGPRAEDEALRWGVVLAEILAYLHVQRPPIVFRDLKPENVMRTADGVLKLVDFGLARAFAESGTSETAPSGSVGYAAPELWEEDAAVDARADVYSWAATVAFFLTGRHPSPVAPTSVLEGIGPELSAATRDLLDRCLQPRPDARPADALALLQEVAPRTDPSAGSVSPSVLRRRASDRAGEPQPARATGRGSRSPFAATSRAARWRPLRAPLLLLILATLGFALLLGSQLPLGPPEPEGSGSTPPAVGVAPYQPAPQASELREQGRSLYDEGKWEQAIEALDRAATANPQDALAHILKENAYVRMSRQPFVRVPFVGSASGVDAPDWNPHLYGLCLAQAALNAGPGINGRKLLVDCYDDQSSTSRCLQIAERLVRDPSVTVVLGATNSQRTLACAPIFNAAHVNLVAPAASAQKIFESGPYLFSASDAREPLVRALARHATRAGYHRVAVVRDETSRLSSEMVRIFEEVARGGGGTCLTLPSYHQDQADFAPQVQAILRERPDAVFVADYRVAPLTRLAVQMRAAGVTIPLVSQTVAFARDLIAQGGDSVEGLLITSQFHPQIDTPRMRRLMAEFRRRFGDVTPTYPMPCSYDALNAVCEGLRVANGREALNTYFWATGVSRPPFEGVVGPFAFGRQMNARPVWLIQVHRGRFRLLGRDPGAPPASASLRPSAADGALDGANRQSRILSAVRPSARLAGVADTGR